MVLKVLEAATYQGQQRPQSTTPKVSVLLEALVDGMEDCLSGYSQD